MIFLFESKDSPVTYNFIILYVGWCGTRKCLVGFTRDIIYRVKKVSY